MRSKFKSMFRSARTSMRRKTFCTGCGLRQRRPALYCERCGKVDEAFDVSTLPEWNERLLKRDRLQPPKADAAEAAKPATSAPEPKAATLLRRTWRRTRRAIAAFLQLLLRPVSALIARWSSV